MDKYLSPSFNFFTSTKLNRHSGKRLLPDLLNEKINDKNTKIIVLSNLKFFVSWEPSIHVLYLKKSNLPPNIFLPEDYIFLGETGNINFVCLDLTNHPGVIETLSGQGEFGELRSFAQIIDREEAAVLSYARALIHWHASHKYCGKCGFRNKSIESGHRLLCTNPKCNTEHFPRTDPAVIMLVERGEKCLLARQAMWPKGQYSTIAGFVEPGESLEQAVQREVLEETGINVEKIKYHSSQPWPFPSSIMLGFRTIASNDEIKLGDHELEDARWLTRNEIISELKEGKLKLSSPISVSFRLIQDWFDEISETSLEDLVKSVVK